MQQLMQFLHMGGYAFYVWLAYAVALLFLSINLIMPVVKRRQLLRSLKNKLGNHNEGRT